jgi:hypothetical protein
MEEEKKMVPKGQEPSGGGSTNVSSIKNETNAPSKRKTLADNLAVPTHTGTNMTASNFFANYDKMSTAELFQLVKQRKGQYWALANFLHKEVATKLDETVFQC